MSRRSRLLVAGLRAAAPQGMSHRGACALFSVCRVIYGCRRRSWSPAAAIVGSVRSRKQRQAHRSLH
eukprot:4840184-Alexandrium_andersonii.AAC.1